VATLDKFVGSFVFEVSIADLPGFYNTFTRVSGVSSESEQLTWMQGMDRSVNTAPGKVKYADITLERVFQGPDAFYGWRRDVEEGKGMDDSDTNKYRKTVEIRLYKRDHHADKTAPGTLVRHVKLIGAWPSRWQFPDMDASASNMATETIVLTVQDAFEEYSEFAKT
jgi:phage tail-like protein